MASEVIDISEDEVVKPSNSNILNYSDNDVIDILSESEEPPRKRFRSNCDTISRLREELREAKKEKRKAEGRLEAMRKNAEKRFEWARSERKKAEEILEEAKREKMNTAEKVGDMQVNSRRKSIRNPIDAPYRVSLSTFFGASSDAQFVIILHGGPTCESIPLPSILSIDKHSALIGCPHVATCFARPAYEIGSSPLSTITGPPMQIGRRTLPPQRTLVSSSLTKPVRIPTTFFLSSSDSLTSTTLIAPF